MAFRCSITVKGNHIVSTTRVSIDVFNISDELFSISLKHQAYLRTGNCHNPHDLFTLRASSSFLHDILRSIIPHKFTHVVSALTILMAFNGVSRFSYGLKKVIIIRALDFLRLRLVRNYTTVGRLSNEVNWEYQENLICYLLPLQDSHLKYFFC